MRTLKETSDNHIERYKTPLSDTVRSFLLNFQALASCSAVTLAKETSPCHRCRCRTLSGRRCLCREQCRMELYLDTAIICCFGKVTGNRSELFKPRKAPLWCERATKNLSIWFCCLFFFTHRSTNHLFSSLNDCLSSLAQLRPLHESPKPRNHRSLLRGRWFPFASQ